MASLKVLRRRIRSVTSVQQITKAMEMVAAARLRRAQARALAARPYAAKLTEMLENLSATASEMESPLFQAREVKRTALVVVTGERGLCGAYNANLVRAAEERLRSAERDSVALVLVGRKGRDYFRRRRYPVLETWVGLPPQASVDYARRVTQDLIARFLAREVDRVEILYTRFFSALRRRVVTEVFLPVGAGERRETETARDFIFEPAPEPIFEELLPRFAAARMFAAMADARASEESSRMTAMGAATKNAGELLDLLVLQRNRARQTMITKEILEVVSGAEALK